MASDPILRIGTRGSALALAQAHQVADLLRAAHPELGSEGALEIRVFKTTGDRVQDRPLSQVGGKGLFTKELEDALLGDEIDLAVHSLKDVPTKLPDGLAIRCVLPREDPRDALITPYPDLQHLPPYARVGTSSLRRVAQLLRLRPDLTPVPLRGNVDTRLGRLQSGELDAIILAAAGLHRLNRREVITAYLPPHEMLPAVAQGSIGIETRTRDSEVLRYLLPLHCHLTASTSMAERAFLRRLDGNCTTPIAGYAVLEGTELTLWGRVLNEDGTECTEAMGTAQAENAIQLGVQLAEEILEQQAR